MENRTEKPIIIDGYVKMLLDILQIGKGNGIHLNKLAAKMGLKPAVVKRIVQDARIVHGFIIIGDDFGYYFPENDGDIRKFYFMMRKQAIQRLITIRPIRKYLRECKGQIKIDGMEKNKDDKLENQS